MNLEILGLSGVGKTTIVNECFGKKNKSLNYLFVAQKSSKVSQLNSIRMAIILLLKITRKSIRSAIYLLTSKVGLRLLLRLGSRCILIKKTRNNNNTLLIDCGVLMPFVESVMVDDLLWSESLLVTMMSVLPIPDAVFYICIKEDLSYKRFINRNYTNYSYLGEMDGVLISKAKFNNANNCLLFILDYLRKRSKVIIMYKNEGQINCEVITKDFHSLLR